MKNAAFVIALLALTACGSGGDSTSSASATTGYASILNKTFAVGLRTKAGTNCALGLHVNSDSKFAMIVACEDRPGIIYYEKVQGTAAVGSGTITFTPEDPFYCKNTKSFFSDGNGEMSAVTIGAKLESDHVILKSGSTIISMVQVSDTSSIAYVAHEGCFVSSSTGGDVWTRVDANTSNSL